MLRLPCLSLLVVSMLTACEPTSYEVRRLDPSRLVFPSRIPVGQPAELRAEYDSACLLDDRPTSLDLTLDAENHLDVVLRATSRGTNYACPGIYAPRTAIRTWTPPRAGRYVVRAWGTDGLAVAGTFEVVP